MGSHRMQPRAHALLVAGVAVLLATVAESRAEAWKHPHMSWGAPDLQGTWTNATITGLERPDSLEELALTSEQASQIENGTAEFMASIDQVPDGELEAGKDVGGYNTFWMDPPSTKP